MKQCAKTQFVQLKLREPEPLPDDDAEDADVHRVGERVLVETAQRRHRDHRGLIVEDLVDDALNSPLHLPGIHRLPQAYSGEHILRYPHRLRVRSLGLNERVPLDQLGLLRLDQRPDVDMLRRRLAQGVEERRKRFVARVPQEESQERGPLLALYAGCHADLPDAVTGQHGCQVSEGREVGQIKPQPGLIEKEKVTRDIEVERPLITL